MDEYASVPRNWDVRRLGFHFTAAVARSNPPSSGGTGERPQRAALTVGAAHARFRAIGGAWGANGKSPDRSLPKTRLRL